MRDSEYNANEQLAAMRGTNPLFDALDARMDELLRTMPRVSPRASAIRRGSTCSDEERLRIEREMNVLKSMSAAMSGVPVNLGAALDALPDGEPLGLLGLWHESEEAT